MRGDKAPILRLDLNKSDSELITIAEAFGIDKESILKNKLSFKTLFFLLDNNLNYILFAYIKKGNKKDVEYMISFDKYLKSLGDSNINTFLKIKKTFERLNNNTKYLLGEEHDKDKIKSEKHIYADDKKEDKKEDKKLNKKVTREPKLITIDSVLDKISSRGIESLSDEEKEFLNNYSKE
jgi:hypothetical protein